MIRPQAGRGLFYTRDSGGQHEMTPGQYVNWAAREALRLGVSFDGTADMIEQMIRDGHFQLKSLFLDYDVKGNQLSRPGLDALLAECLRDPTVSHVFIPRRDRLARPENPVDGIKLEFQFRSAGITVVFTGKVCDPIQKGERQDIADLIVSLVDYDRAGKDRRDLAHKIILAQIALANLGYTTGGRPPYGFRRWLVRDDGTVLRQLAEGERVRTRGQHVVWLPVPEDHPEMIVIRRILGLLRTKPASQVARILNDESVPSPDHGRVRTDRGIKHVTSGVWHQSTIINIARNKLLMAVSSYGRRSMGDQLRFTAEGPRPLTDQDFSIDNKPKVIRNDACVRRPARFEAVVPPAEHEELIKILDGRAGTQRGKPRSREPGKNPLGSRVFDMKCGWPMYRTPHSNSFRYTCGFYMQSRQCEHNHIDGPLATRFVLTCLQQKLLTPRLLTKLKNRMQELAADQRLASSGAADLKALRAELQRVRTDLSKVEKNMALADTQEQYRAMAKVFEDFRRQDLELQQKIADSESDHQGVDDPEAQVQAAMSKLDRLPELVADDESLQRIGEAFKMVNVRLFLSFEKRQIKKRMLNKLACGVLTFGDVPAPVELYKGPTGRRAIESRCAASFAAGSEGDAPLPNRCDGWEGKSLGNINRGDRI